MVGRRDADPVHPEPSADQLAAIAAYRPDGPFVALDLDRYRKRAAPTRS